MSVTYRRTARAF